MLVGIVVMKVIVMMRMLIADACRDSSDEVDGHDEHGDC